LVDFSKEKVLTVEDEEGQKETYDFNQHSTGFINEVSYYGIEMEGKDYYVVFDDKKDEDNANLIVQTNHASDFEDVVGDVVFEMMFFCGRKHRKFHRKEKKKYIKYTIRHILYLKFVLFAVLWMLEIYGFTLWMEVNSTKTRDVSLLIINYHIIKFAGYGCVCINLYLPFLHFYGIYSSKVFTSILFIGETWNT